MADDSEPVRIPITGELDLHAFRPSEVASVVAEYLAACRTRGLTSARIIHGKGTGTLRETVHALLRRSPLVESFHLGNETSGSWGATVVRIRPPAN
jgi:DNA-nicking Smr family endonuclease